MSAFETGDSRYMVLLFKCMAIAAIGLLCIYLIAPKAPSTVDSKGQDDLLGKPLGQTISQ